MSRRECTEGMNLDGIRDANFLHQQQCYCSLCTKPQGCICKVDAELDASKSLAILLQDLVVLQDVSVKM